MSTTKAALVSYELDDSIATIVMNDGGNNLISPNMLGQLNAALDRAERDKAVVILTGTGTIFSAGFDLKILRTGVSNSFNMLVGGFKLSKRLLSFPTPILIAVNGHAIAMGVFLVLSGDYRIGVEGDFKIVANEVKLGLTMPYSAVEICRQRLTPANFTRAVLLSEQYTPQSGQEAGFLDEVTDADKLLIRARNLANTYVELDLEAHRQSKIRMRKAMLRSLTIAIRADQINFISQGFRRLFRK